MLRRRLTRYSRRDLLWALALFVVGQLGLALAIDVWLPQFRDPFYAHRAELLRQRTVAAPTRCVTAIMLGSSRVQMGLMPRALGEQISRESGRNVLLFNFGVPQCGPVGSLLYFERLRAQGVKPDLLLIDVAPMLLARRIVDGPPLTPLEARYARADRLWRHELAFVEHYGFPQEELRKAWWQSWPVPCYGQRFTILSHFFPQLLCADVRAFLETAWRIDESGWKPQSEATITAEVRRKGRDFAWGEFGDVLGRFQLCESACRAQRDLLMRCQDEGIGAILVLMPEGDEFRHWYSPAATAQIDRHLRALSREFAVPVIDARRWVADEGFSDGHHMLPAGAAVFTERLGRDVLAPVLALDAQQRREYLARWAQNELESIVDGDVRTRRPILQAAADRDAKRR